MILTEAPSLDFGSHQYSDINNSMKKFFNNMPKWVKEDMVNLKPSMVIGNISENGNITINSKNILIDIDALNKIIENIKNGFIEQVKINIEDWREFYGEDEKLEDYLPSIEKIQTVEDCYNYCKNLAWDLWSANNFIMSYFYLDDGRLDDNSTIAISILWLLENNIVSNPDCFCNFST